MTIRVQPEGSRVFIDNEYRGESPVTVQLEAGRYEVLVVKPEYGAESVWIDVFSGQESTFEVELKSASGGLDNVRRLLTDPKLVQFSAQLDGGWLRLRSGSGDIESDGWSGGVTLAVEMFDRRALLEAALTTASLGVSTPSIQFLSRLDRTSWSFRAVWKPLEQVQIRLGRGSEGLVAASSAVAAADLDLEWVGWSIGLGAGGSPIPSAESLFVGVDGEYRPDWDLSGTGIAGGPIRGAVSGWRAVVTVGREGSLVPVDLFLVATWSRWEPDTYSSAGLPTGAAPPGASLAPTYFPERAVGITANARVRF